MKSHCGNKTILRPFYLHKGISYTGKTTSLYWIRLQMAVLSEKSKWHLMPALCRFQAIIHGKFLSSLCLYLNGGLQITSLLSLSVFIRTNVCIQIYIVHDKLSMSVQISAFHCVPKAPVTLSRPDSRPFPTLMVGRGLVKSSGCRERTGMGLGRSWEVGELGRGVPDCFELFKTIGSSRGWRAVLGRALGSRVRSSEGR